MLVPLILSFIASVLLIFGVSRLFRVWMRGGPATKLDQLSKDAKMMDSSGLTADERQMLRERMKQKLQEDLKH